MREYRELLLLHYNGPHQGHGKPALVNLTDQGGGFTTTVRIKDTESRFGSGAYQLHNRFTTTVRIKDTESGGSGGRGEGCYSFTTTVRIKDTERSQTTRSPKTSASALKLHYNGPHQGHGK